MDVGQLNPDNITEAFQRLTLFVLSMGEPHVWSIVSSKNKDQSAGWGELLIAETTDGDISVRLPTPTASDAGREIAVRQMSASNTCYVRISEKHTIDGAAGPLSLSGGAGATIVYIGGTEWVTL